MIEDHEIRSMAEDLARTYGVAAAIGRATERALAELEQGHLRVATTWRRVLNALNRIEPPTRDSRHPVPAA